jgi:hypothetical protein
MKTILWILRDTLFRELVSAFRKPQLEVAWTENVKRFLKSVLGISFQNIGGISGGKKRNSEAVMGGGGGVRHHAQRSVLRANKPKKDSAAQTNSILGNRGNFSLGTNTASLWLRNYQITESHVVCKKVKYLCKLLTGKLFGI